MTAKLLDDRTDIYRLSQRLRFSLVHFARGIYPCLGHPPNSMPVNRMFFVLDNPGGDANYIGDADSVHPLRPNHFYFVPAFHQATFRLDSRLVFLSIHSKVELYGATDIFAGRHFIYCEDAPSELPRLLELHRATAAELLPAALELQQLAFAVVMRVIKNTGGNDYTNAARFAAYQPVIDHISKNCRADVRIADLAAIMHLSREAFSRNFVADTGITPKKFVARMLMNRATALLSRPHCSIKEVAHELNFSSEYAFSRFFKTQAGISPKAFCQFGRI